jgi:hypothetical protein
MKRAQGMPGTKRASPIRPTTFIRGPCPRWFINGPEKRSSRHPASCSIPRGAPANGWSYYGLVELHKARGDAGAARKAEADLAKTWIGDRKLLQISNL